METTHHHESKKDIGTLENIPNKDYWIPASIVISALIISSAWVYTAKVKNTEKGGIKTSENSEIKTSNNNQGIVSLVEKTIPVVWGDLGVKMVNAGVIDRDKFLQIYADRGGLSSAEKKLLDGTDNGKITVSEENSGVILNLLWALGLGNKNDILDNGEMKDPRYGNPGNFASTGGWIIAKGNPMDHYSMHPFIALTKEQQELVERTSKNIFRPCCGNSTHFPDCNHGMAMLGLLELMASQGATESQMYETALVMNSFWFPDQYLAIGEYFKSKGTSIDKVDPRQVLSAEFSSGQGFQKIISEITQPIGSGNAPTRKSGGGCGV